MADSYPGGYMGKVLRDNFGSGRIGPEKLEEKTSRKYVDGRISNLTHSQHIDPEELNLILDIERL